MIFYFSGGGDCAPGTKWRFMNEFLVDQGVSRLLSFAYGHQIESYCDLVREYKKPIRMLIDSGAFTAWSLGKPVDIEALSSKFGGVVEKYGDLITFNMINLDVIPGRKGRDATKDEIRQAMLDSKSNFELLNARFPGMVVPVFHQDEPRSYLNELESVCEYVCLSPRNDLPEVRRVEWAQEVATGGKQYHGLATTGSKMLLSVPWYSVDSASWIMAGAYGGIFVPHEDGFRVIKISNESPVRQVFEQHFDSVSPVAQKEIKKSLEEEGFDLEGVKSDQWQRYKWNALQWVRWEKIFTFNKQPKQRLLFNA